MENRNMFQHLVSNLKQIGLKMSKVCTRTYIDATKYSVTFNASIFKKLNSLNEAL